MKNQQNTKQICKNTGFPRDPHVVPPVGIVFFHGPYGYSSAASARDAISSMDGASFQGRTLVVKLKDTGTQQKQN